MDKNVRINIKPVTSIGAIYGCGGCGKQFIILDENFKEDSDPSDFTECPLCGSEITEGTTRQITIESINYKESKSTTSEALSRDRVLELAKDIGYKTLVGTGFNKVGCNLISRLGDSNYCRLIAAPCTQERASVCSTRKEYKATLSKMQLEDNICIENCKTCIHRKEDGSCAINAKASEVKIGKCGKNCNGCDYASAKGNCIIHEGEE